MKRGLPHRLSDGRCRDCGQHDPWSAPDSCARCAIEQRRARGYEIVVNPSAQFVHVADEAWRQVHQDLASGWVQPNRFYVYIGHGDGGPLVQPMGEDNPGTWVFAGAAAAQTAGRALLARYSEAWVVTNAGAWNVRAPKAASS